VTRLLAYILALAVGAALGWTVHDLATTRKVVCGWYDVGGITPNMKEE